MNSQNKFIPSLQGAIALIGALALFVAVFQVIYPFRNAFGWSFVVTLSCWPIFSFLKSKLTNNQTIAALISTLLVIAIVLIVFIPISVSLFVELKDLGKILKSSELGSLNKLISLMAEVPIVGAYFSSTLNHLPSATELIESILSLNNGAAFRFAGNAASEVFGIAFDLVFAIILMFFFFRDGHKVARQILKGLKKLFGARVDHLVDTVLLTVKGAMYGLFMTAFVQSILAGIGFIAAGAPTPALLSAATFLFSMIPFGTPFVYVPACLYVASEVSLLSGGLLFAWCVLVVSLADNIIRPIFISRTASLPILLVLFGVIGGLISFGPLGIFLGPVLMAVCLGIWKEFLVEEKTPGAGSQNSLNA